MGWMILNWSEGSQIKQRRCFVVSRMTIVHRCWVGMTVVMSIEVVKSTTGKLEGLDLETLHS